MKIDLPYDFVPRDYQLPLLEAMDSGYRRAFIMWHRRAGKDLTAWNILIKKAFTLKGVYYYFFPTYRQGKKIVWDSITDTVYDDDENILEEGKKFLDYIPLELRKNVNNTEMKVELINGSIIQIVGADNVDNLVGTNLKGAIFSEFFLMKPEVWSYIRPILASNNGWAIFVSTPRGLNHAGTMYLKVEKDPKWFTEVLSIEDTNTLSQEVIDQEKKEMPEDLFKQEYYCKLIDGASSYFKGIDNVVKDVFYNSSHEHRGGADLGEKNDYTVLTTIDLNNFAVLPQERFNKEGWTAQEMRMENWYYKHHHQEIVIDSTGVGAPIVERLQERGLPVIPFVFSTRTRRDLLENLRLKIANMIITLPNDPNLLNELKAYRYELNQSGKVVIKGAKEDGGYDDMVMSLALAVWQLGDRPSLLFEDYGMDDGGWETPVGI